MKIELNIDGALVGETIQKTFDNFTEEQSKEIAQKVASEWFTKLNDVPAHRAAYEAKVIQDIRNEESYYKYKSADEIKQNYKFLRKMEEYIPPSKLMIDTITKQVQAFVVKSVQEEITKNDIVKKTVEAISTEIKANFKAYVHDAMVAYMCSHMESIGTGISRALAQSSNAEQIVNNIRGRLNV